MAKKYFSLNEVPIGTKMIVKKTNQEVVLVEIQNFPTTFICFQTFSVPHFTDRRP